MRLSSQSLQLKAELRKKCCRRYLSAEITWFFPPAHLHSVSERILPASLGLCDLPPQKTHCWHVSGPCWELLFSVTLNESKMGLHSLASLKWSYLSCALSDRVIASVMCSWVRWWTREEDVEHRLLQAGRRISSAWRIWHRSTSEKGDSEHVDWTSEKGKPALLLCVDEEEEFWIRSSLYAFIYMVSHSAQGLLASAPIHEASDWDTLPCWNVWHWKAIFCCPCPPSKAVAFWCFRLLAVSCVSAAISESETSALLAVAAGWVVEAWYPVGRNSACSL